MSGYPKDGFLLESSAGEPNDSNMYPVPGEGYPQQSAGHPPPITTQPTTMPGYLPPGGNLIENWMPKPVGPICPPGLEYLAWLEQLLIYEEKVPAEGTCDMEKKKKYTIRNNKMQKIYTVTEESDCCYRNCLGNCREFNLKIEDSSGNEVMHLYQPLRCSLCCCLWCFCLEQMQVTAPPGNMIGTVAEKCSIFQKFALQNAANETILSIERPSRCSDMGNLKEMDYKIMSADGVVEIGNITQQCAGKRKVRFSLDTRPYYFTDHFVINFPMDLDITMKATVLGASFLIESLYLKKIGKRRPGLELEH